MMALFDTNVVLDVLLKREDFFKNSLASIIVADYHNYQACITSNAMADIYYIASKLIGKDKARDLIEQTFGLFRVIDINELDCLCAYELPKSEDFEDAIVYASAKRNKVDCIITRDKRHYKDNEISIFTPETFLETHEKPWND